MTNPLPKTRARRAGFSLVELLAVVLCVAAALSLLIPALRVSAAAARQAQCQNNLRQIALAALNYEGRCGAFPSGPASLPGGGAPLSWQVVLLPELDLGRMAETIDFSQPPSFPGNAALTGTFPETLHCPADPAGGGSYAGVRHHEDTRPAPTDTGLLRVGRPVTAAACVDGLSHTLLCGEKQSPGGFGTWFALGSGSVRTVHAAPNADRDAGFGGHHDVGGGRGCLMAVADGAVRWVPGDVDPAVFERLGRFSDGSLPPEWGVVR